MTYGGRSRADRAPHPGAAGVPPWVPVGGGWVVVDGGAVAGWLVVGRGIGAAGGRRTGGGAGRRRAVGRWWGRGRAGLAACRVGLRLAGTGGEGGGVAAVVDGVVGVELAGLGTTRGPTMTYGPLWMAPVQRPPRPPAR